MSENYEIPGGFPAVVTGHQDSCHEVNSVMAEVEEWAGPRNLAIVVIISEDCQPEVRDRCIEYPSVFVETELSFPTRVRNLIAQNPSARQRLSFIVSPKVDSISLQIPSNFHKLSIYACEKQRSYARRVGATQTIKELVLEDDSTYCGIALAQWNQRTEHLSHELITGPGVVMDLPDGDILDGEREQPPISLQNEQSVDEISQYIEREMGRPLSQAPMSQTFKPSSFPWAAGLAGGAAGIGTAATFLVSSVKIGVRGLFISAGPHFQAGLASATLQGAIAMGASATLTSAGVGAAVAAAVYFIPWRKLASWFVDKFYQFMGFLKTVWAKVKEGLRFLKSLLTTIMQFLRSPVSSIMRVVVG